MYPVSPVLFATTISGALRLGREAYRSYREKQVEKEDFFVFVPPLQSVPAEEIYTLKGTAAVQSWVRDWIAHGDYFRPGGAYEGVFLLTENGSPRSDPTDGGCLVDPARQDLLDQALVDLLRSDTFSNRPDARKDAEDSLFVYQHKLWNNPAEQSVWGRFFRHFVDVALDIVAVQPSVLGVSGNVESFVKALFPNLAQSYSAEGPVADTRMRLTDVFAEAMLKTLADNPSLVTTEKRWQTLISGVLEPLQAEAAEDGFGALIAERRIRDLIGGPMGYAALGVFSENADEFLKGEFGEDQIIGRVARETLGAFVSTRTEGSRVRDVFSEAGAVTVLKSALNVARNDPKLFIGDTDGDNLTTEAAQSLLAGVADVLYDAKPPFDRASGLGPQFAEVGLNVMQTYTAGRLESGAGQSKAQLGGELLASVFGSLMLGLEGDGADKRRGLFARVFSKEQAMDVMSILAMHVAKSPQIVVGKTGNPAVTAMAEAVALAIASDEDGLLTGEDWRGIVAVMMDTALKNPGRLFGLDENVSPSDSIALMLVTRIMQTASESLREPLPTSGRVLFGGVLANAIRITLVAAGSGALTVIKETASDPDKLDAHLDGVTNLARRLNKLAASRDPESVISADDWLQIYKLYVATAIEKGSAAINETAPTDAELLAALSGGILSQPKESVG